MGDDIIGGTIFPSQFVSFSKECNKAFVKSLLGQSEIIMYMDSRSALEVLIGKPASAELLKVIKIEDGKEIVSLLKEIGEEMLKSSTTKFVAGYVEARRLTALVLDTETGDTKFLEVNVLIPEVEGMGGVIGRVFIDKALESLAKIESAIIIKSITHRLCEKYYE